MSPFRHVLLHADSSQLTEARLRVAAGLASQFKAEVTALYAVIPWLLLYPPAVEGAGLLMNDLSELDAQRLAGAREKFERVAADLPQVQWAELLNESPDAFARQALCADLLVMGQYDPRDPARGDVPADFVSSMVIQSGKPALVVPHEGATAHAYPSVLVAWNASRESARAVTAALPFLQRAREVHVACFSGHADCSADSAPDIERFLNRHGIRPVRHQAQASSRDVGHQLLALARDVGADLLVMGCYGHARTREWVLGGTTRTVLKDMSVPVLMVH